MNLQPAHLPVETDEDERELFSGSPPVGWQMKQLKPRHKQIAALIAQGMPYKQIAALCDVTTPYISMLSRQPLMKAYILQMCEATGVRLEAMFEKVVDTIAVTLESGTEAGKLKAARLQLEATKRIGRPDTAPRGADGGTDRLEKLAQRLIYLQSGKRSEGLYSENGEEITDAEFSESIGSERSEST